LIWGYNAREEEDFRLYGLENASFKQRTIRRLKDETTNYTNRHESGLSLQPKRQPKWAPDLGS
jgi:hypothetical protein